MYYIAQILGGLAIIAWVISILLQDKKDLLLCQTIANFIYGIEYSLLNAYSAASMNFCSFIRLLIYYFFARKNKQTPKAILLIFVIVILLLGIFTYNNLLSFIPVIITIAYAYSLWQNNLLITRIIYVVSAVVWIFYNYSVGAHVGIIGNILEITAGLVSIVKYRK